jgi:hypothetical protein
MTRRLAYLLLPSLLLALPGPAAQAELTTEQVRRSLDRAIGYLRREQLKRGHWAELAQGGYHGGVTALCTLALLESGVDAEDPTVRRALNHLRSVDAKKTYVVALQTMVFCRAGQVADRARIRENIRWLESAQNTSNGDDHGAWGYSGGPGTDNSNSQFAVLALHEAEQAGFQVQPRTWQLALGYWRRAQNTNGSWGYNVRSPGRGSMTCAGIASLVIAMDSQGEGGAMVDDGQCVCGTAVLDERVDRAIAWLGRNFSVTRNPDETASGPQIGGNSRWLFYYLYGVERVGRVTARRFFYSRDPRTKLFRRHDWYREGADFLIRTQNADGSWKGDIPQYPHIATSLALLFLSKGRRPVLISKLRRADSDWDRLRRDLTNLTRYTERKWKLPMTWQVIDAEKSTADDYAQTPVLFISGSRPFRFTQAQRSELRRYVEQGGFIFADGCCGGEDFDRSFRTEMQEIFPERGYELKQLDAQHPIWSIDERIDPQFVDRDGRWLWGIDFACRTSVVYCPGNLSCYWELDSLRRAKDYSKPVRDEIAACRSIGVNVLAYATNRKLKPKDAIPQRLAKAKSQGSGQRGYFAIAKLRHAGGCDAAPRAMVNLMEATSYALEIRTAAEVQLLQVTDESIFDHHFLYMHGRHDFRLSAPERRQLKTFVERGGTIMADAICASPTFAKAFRREMREVFGQPLEQIPPDDSILTAEYGGFDLGNVTRRESVRLQDGGPLEIKERRGPADLEGLKVEDRYGVVFSPLDLSCALEKHVSPHCRGYTPEDAARIAMNVMLYSLQQ